MSPRRPRKASQLATALIEHSSDAIALLDEAGTVLYANPATARMLGLPITDVIGANVFRWVHDEDALRFKANFGTRLENPGMAVQNAFRLRHSDGSWRHIESVGEEVTDLQIAIRIHAPPDVVFRYSSCPAPARPRFPPAHWRCRPAVISKGDSPSSIRRRYG